MTRAIIQALGEAGVVFEVAFEVFDEVGVEADICLAIEDKFRDGGDAVKDRATAKHEEAAIGEKVVGIAQEKDFGEKTADGVSHDVEGNIGIKERVFASFAGGKEVFDIVEGLEARPEEALRVFVEAGADGSVEERRVEEVGKFFFA